MGGGDKPLGWGDIDKLCRQIQKRRRWGLLIEGPGDPAIKKPPAEAGGLIVPRENS